MTVKLLQNVSTKKYSYEMVNPSYYDGRTIPVFRLADAILCIGQSTTINLAGSNGTPQWQSSPSGADIWSNIIGETGLSILVTPGTSTTVTPRRSR